MHSSSLDSFLSKLYFPIEHSFAHDSFMFAVTLDHRPNSHSVQSPGLESAVTCFPMGHGMIVGARVGTEVGTEVGADVGTDVGVEVGEYVGVADGAEVGILVGEYV